MRLGVPDPDGVKTWDKVCDALEVAVAEPLPVCHWVGDALWVAEGADDSVPLCDDDVLEDPVPVEECVSVELALMELDIA